MDFSYSLAQKLLTRLRNKIKLLYCIEIYIISALGTRFFNIFYVGTLRVGLPYSNLAVRLREESSIGPLFWYLLYAGSIFIYLLYLPNNGLIVGISEAPWSRDNVERLPTVGTALRGVSSGQLEEPGRTR